jgi:membrane-associated protein
MDFILHIDKYLGGIISQYHTYTYLILFAFIFAETGFVVTPFIPGDSLLFAMGALLAGGKTGLNIYLLAAILIVAAVLGDLLNYHLGKYFGPKVFKKENKILKLEYYEKTKKFFDVHGGKSVTLGRFLPLIRTFIPFVAGISGMTQGKFLRYNVVGGIAWIVVFLSAGYFFGNIPVVKNNFSIVVVGIIATSLIPVIYAAVKRKKA